MDFLLYAENTFPKYFLKNWIGKNKNTLIKISIWIKINVRYIYKGETMIKDILQRDKFVRQVVKLINTMEKRNRGYTFAIDGKWGCGKSFVLEMIEKEISIFEATEKELTKENNKYFLFHYNCWQYDYYDEPLVAITAALRDSITEYKEIIDSKYVAVNNCWDKMAKCLLNISNQIVKNKIGIDFKEATDEISKDRKDFDTYLSLKTTLNDTRTAIKELATIKPVVIIVDELDRCLPEYAIKVLERLHHIFYDIEKVIVIMAVDNNQLDNTVKRIFGKETDTDKYLKKFIDFKLYLDQGQYSNEFMEKFDFYFSKFNIEDREAFQEGIKTLFEHVKIREQEKIIRKADLIHSVATDKQYSKSVCLFELLYLILKLDIDGDYGVKWLVRYIWEGGGIPDDIVRKKEGYDIFVKEICDSNIFTVPDEWDREELVKLFSSSQFGLALWYLVFVEENYIREKNIRFRIRQFDDDNVEEVGFAKEFARIAKII
jgi:hypothetical protein